MKATITVNITYDHDDEAKAEDVHDLLTNMLNSGVASGVFSSRWYGGKGPRLEADDVDWHIKVRGPQRFMYHPVPDIQRFSDDELTEEIRAVMEKSKEASAKWLSLLSAMGRDYPSLERRGLISKAREQDSGLCDEAQALAHDLELLKNEFEHRVREGKYE